MADDILALMTHYICTGECGGVSEKPGVCNAQSCTKHNQPLVECNCKNHKTSDAKLIAYLNFEGEATRQAMEFYKSIFGGSLTMQTFSEAGMAEKEEYNDYIIHADLANEIFTIYASSGMPGQKVNFGDSISLSIVGSDDKALRGYFEKLSEGGKIVMPLEKQFWGDVFGMVKDKFGINWMVNISGGDKND